MTDTPPDWVLIEAAKRSGEILTKDNVWPRHAAMFPTAFRALCDMIQKYEQPPVDRKLLCARMAKVEDYGYEPSSVNYEATMRGEYDALNSAEMGLMIRAIELWEEGFGK